MNEKKKKKKKKKKTWQKSLSEDMAGQGSAFII